LEILITLLFALATILVVVTLVGHGMWLLLAWIFGHFSGKTSQPSNVRYQAPVRSQNCNFEVSIDEPFCSRCGLPGPAGLVVELLKDLAATERQIERFQRM